LIVCRQLTDQKIGKDTHTMTKDNLIALKNPVPFVDDPISEILRTGARKLLAQALETEIELFLSQYHELADSSGRQRIVRNEHLPWDWGRPFVYKLGFGDILYSPCQAQSMYS